MKARPSKLDPFLETLQEMDLAGRTLAEMQEWLRGEGVAVSIGRLSGFLDAARQARLQERLLGQIVTGARQCKEVEKQFGGNPAPQLETLIGLHRVLVMKLSTQANADPRMIEMVTSLMKPVMDWAKLGLKREEIGLAREKFQRETVQLFIQWFADESAKKILASNTPNAEKTERLGQRLFGDLWK